MSDDATLHLLKLAAKTSLPGFSFACLISTPYITMKYGGKGGSLRFLMIINKCLFILPLF